MENSTLSVSTFGYIYRLQKVLSTLSVGLQNGSTTAERARAEIRAFGKCFSWAVRPRGSAFRTLAAEKILAAEAYLTAAVSSKCRKADLITLVVRSNRLLRSRM